MYRYRYNEEQDEVLKKFIFAGKTPIPVPKPIKEEKEKGKENSKEGKETKKGSKEKLKKEEPKKENKPPVLDIFDIGDEEIEVVAKMVKPKKISKSKNGLQKTKTDTVVGDTIKPLIDEPVIIKPKCVEVECPRQHDPQNGLQVTKYDKSYNDGPGGTLFYFKDE